MFEYLKSPNQIGQVLPVRKDNIQMCYISCILDLQQFLFLKVNGLQRKMNINLINDACILKSRLSFYLTYCVDDLKVRHSFFKSVKKNFLLHTVYCDFPHNLSIHWFKINLISKYILKVQKVRNSSEYIDTIPLADNEYQPTLFCRSM